MTYNPLASGRVALDGSTRSALRILFAVHSFVHFGEPAVGANHGVLYPGSGGMHNVVLSAIVIGKRGYPVSLGTAGLPAICAGLVVITLKNSPPLPNRATIVLGLQTELAGYLGASR